MIGVASLASLAYAQSVPAIPAIPPPPSLGNIPAIPLNPEMKAAETNAKAAAAKEAADVKPPPALPVASPLPGSSDRVEADTVPPIPPLPSVPAVATAVPTPPPPADANIVPPVSAPPVPGGADGVASVPPPIPPLSTDAMAGNVPPPLPLPEAISGSASPADGAQAAEKPKSLAEQMAASPNGIALPPVPEKPKVMQNPNRKKTWLSELKPTVKPYDIDFNYKRQLLPSSIYRSHYDGANQHLPAAITMEDYKRWFLESVAANDVDATRALLNEGIDVNLVNAEGNTALVVALRRGALDTARLLVARGADPQLRGPSGISAVDIAASTGNLWVLARPQQLL